MVTSNSLGNGQVIYTAAKWDATAGVGNLTAQLLSTVIDFGLADKTGAAPSLGLGLPYVTSGSGTQSEVVVTKLDERRWVVFFLRDNLLQVQFSRAVIPVSRVLAQEPATGWTLQGEVSGDIFNLKVTSGASVKWRVAVLA